MPDHRPAVIYWDSSAVLSALFTDNHSRIATEWASRKDFHIISSLAYAEIWAVVSRMRREGILSETNIETAREDLDKRPWRYLNLSPEREIIALLAMKWSLRGADLWHLAAAKTLQATLPEIFLLSFDAALEAAARGEGLIRQ